MNRQELWLIAGSNGAGKTSTLNIQEINERTHLMFKNGKTIPFLNADIIATKAFPDTAPTEYSDSQIFFSGKQTIKARNNLISQKKSFALETTLSGNSEIQLIKNAKDAGYQVNLLYLGITSAEASFARVESRARQGGHYIPKEVVTRRYERSISNLNENLSEFDNAYIFDNTNRNKLLLLQIKNSKLEKVSKTSPPWFRDIHREFKAEHDKHLFLTNPNMFIYDVPYPDRFKAHQAGLSFNSYIKKYTYDGDTPPKIDQQEAVDWSVHKYDDNETIQSKAIPSLENHLAEEGFHVPDGLYAASRTSLIKEDAYQAIMNDASLGLGEKTHKISLSSHYSLEVIPKNNDITVYIFDQNREDIISTWNFKEQTSTTSKRSERYELLRQEDENRHAEGAKKANAIYEHLQPVKPHFGYLQKKQIKASEDLKFISFDDREYFQENLEWKTRYNQMVVPIRNWGNELRSLQIINDDGSWKGLLADGEIQGNFATIGEQDPRKAEQIFIVEGYATGASIHEATNLPVVVAFQTGNLLSVAKQFREHNPHQEIYFGADNDFKSFLKEETNNVKNAGLEFALQAAQEVNGKMTYPNVSNEQEAAVAAHGWDWNDYALHYGKEQTAKELSAQINGRTSTIHESHETTDKRELISQINMTKNDEPKSFLVAKSNYPHSEIILIEKGKQSNTLYPHAFITQNALDQFLENQKYSGFDISSQALVKEKTVVKNKVTEEKQQPDKGIKKEPNDSYGQETILAIDNMTKKAASLEKMSPRIQKFHSTVLEHAKSHNLTNKQMTILRERLQVKSQRLHKQEKSQKPTEREL